MTSSPRHDGWEASLVERLAQQTEDLSGKFAYRVIGDYLKEVPGVTPDQRWYLRKMAWEARARLRLQTKERSHSCAKRRNPLLLRYIPAVSNETDLLAMLNLSGEEPSSFAGPRPPMLAVQMRRNTVLDTKDRPLDLAV